MVRQRQRDDRELLARLRADDRSALRAVHDIYAPGVYALVLRFVKSREDADEVTQDVFMTLWKKRATIEISGTSVLPWLLSTARFVSLNHLRHVGREREAEEAMPPAEFEQLIDERGLDCLAILQLREAVAELSQTDQKIVEACLLHGMPYKQAAAEVGLTHAAVRNRLRRARAHLRAFVTRVEGEHV